MPLMDDLFAAAANLDFEIATDSGPYPRVIEGTIDECGVELDPRHAVFVREGKDVPYILTRDKQFVGLYGTLEDVIRDAYFLPMERTMDARALGGDTDGDIVWSEPPGPPCTPEEAIREAFRGTAVDDGTL